MLAMQMMVLGYDGLSGFGIAIIYLPSAIPAIIGTLYRMYFHCLPIITEKRVVTFQHYQKIQVSLSISVNTVECYTMLVNHNSDSYGAGLFL